MCISKIYDFFSGQYKNIPGNFMKCRQALIMSSQANCRKVFIARDYSDGSGVRFQPRFPVELEGKIDRQLFDYTLKTLNSLYAEAEKANISTYCEGCMVKEWKLT